MQIKEIIKQGNSVLKKNNFDDSLIISKELLCFILKQSKQYLVIHMEEEIEDELYHKFVNYIEQIISGKPLQYITHKQEFMGIEFYVDENVLIPQPDTEILVEKVLDICSKGLKGKTIKILDLCTGSGAIAISLKKILNENNIANEITASDVSCEALYVAKENSKRQNVEVKFETSNLFDSIEENGFDIIVSNPPYIKEHIINELSKQVQTEPRIALSGGKDGLYFYKKIANEAYQHIVKGGYLCLEIGYDQRKEVLDILKEHEQYTESEVIKDLSNNDRCIISKII